MGGREEFKNARMGRAETLPDSELLRIQARKRLEGESAKEQLRIEDANSKICSLCDKYGYDWLQEGSTITLVDCKDCKGSGLGEYDIRYVCGTCNGSGKQRGKCKKEPKKH